MADRKRPHSDEEKENSHRKKKSQANTPPPPKEKRSVGTSCCQQYNSTSRRNPPLGENPNVSYCSQQHNPSLVENPNFFYCSQQRNAALEENPNLFYCSQQYNAQLEENPNLAYSSHQSNPSLMENPNLPYSEFPQVYANLASPECASLTVSMKFVQDLQPELFVNYDTLACAEVHEVMTTMRMVLGETFSRHRYLVQQDDYGRWSFVSPSLRNFSAEQFVQYYDDRSPRSVDMNYLMAGLPMLAKAMNCHFGTEVIVTMIEVWESYFTVLELDPDYRDEEARELYYSMITEQFNSLFWNPCVGYMTVDGVVLRNNLLPHRMHPELYYSTLE